MSRGAFVGIVVGAVVAVTALVVGAIVAVVTLTSPRPTVEPVAGQDTFDLLRLTTGEVDALGWSASSGGLQPRTLASAAASVATNWRNAKGAPDECMFAGGFPGESLVPVWGTEDDATALWNEQSVSATQSFSNGIEPVAWVTYRTFESPDAASAFLAEHDAAVAACVQFETSASGLTTTTAVEAVSFESVGSANSGWVATTADWHRFDSRVDAPRTDIEVGVLDVQRGAVIARVVTVALVGENDIEAFAGIVSDRMTARISP